MELPKGWSTSNLNFLCDIIGTGDSINADEKDAKYKGQADGFPYIGTKDVGFDAVIDYENGVRIPFVNATQFEVAPPDSTLICIEGGSSGRKIGMTNKPVCFGNKLCCLHTTAINARFLYYYCQAPVFQMLFVDKQKAERKSVTTTQLKALSVLVPPLTEQHRIAEKIDALFSKLDKGVEMLHVIRQQLKTYRQAVLKCAFEGRLTNTNYTKWVQTTVSELVIQYQNGLSKRSSSVGIPTKVLRLGDISNFMINETNPRFINLTKDEVEKYSLMKNDLVLIRVNGSVDFVGRLILINNETDWAYCDHLIRIRINQSKMLPAFMKYLFNSHDVRSTIRKLMVSTAGQNTISQTSISNISITLPSLLEEQAAIIAEIESRLTICDKIEAIVDESLSQAEALKQSILKKAFGGELVPQDPDDEPAEKLLERIKAAKKAAAAAIKPTRRKN